MALLNAGWPPHAIVPSLYLAVLPLLVALPVVLSASLVIGLPLSLVLRRLKAESGTAYVLCGLAFGAVIPPAILAAIHAQGGWWMWLLGAFSGGAAAYTWWTHRLQAQRPSTPPQSTRRQVGPDRPASHRKVPAR